MNITIVFNLLLKTIHHINDQEKLSTLNRVHRHKNKKYIVVKPLLSGILCVVKGNLENFGHHDGVCYFKRNLAFAFVIYNVRI